MGHHHNGHHGIGHTINHLLGTGHHGHHPNVIVQETIQPVVYAQPPMQYGGYPPQPIVYGQPTTVVYPQMGGHHMQQHGHHGGHHGHHGHH